MDALHLARTLQLPEMTIRALEKTPLPENHEALRRLYMDGELHSFYEAADGLDGLTMLRTLLEWVPAMHALYQAMGVAEDIFWDNLKDFTLWSQDYVDKHGQPGFDQWRWVGRSLRMNIIRLGRLQFERKALEEDVAIDGRIWPTGTLVLSVHIPAGEPLNIAAVLDSFAQAKDFFPRYFHQDYALLYCHTWLLSPQLKELLPPQSRILQFQSLFTVYGEDQDRQAEERVFGAVSDDIASYPEGTSLQRALKQYLLSGHPVHVGVGLRSL